MTLIVLGCGRRTMRFIHNDQVWAVEQEVVLPSVIAQNTISYYVTHI